MKILGMGCAGCARLEANTRLALGELGIAEDVEKVTDLSDVMEYGVLSLPALVVDEKVLSFGQVLSASEVKKIISKELD